MSIRRLFLPVVTLSLVALVTLAASPLRHSWPQDRPGLPTAGSTSVQISNQPTVNAVQSGEWRVSVPGTTNVALTRTATVTLEAPAFLRTGRTYTIRWQGGQSGIYTIVQIANGWAQVRTPGGASLWVNVAMAAEIAEGQ